MCNSVSFTHLRYVKLENKEDGGALSEALSKFYHLRVLDIGSGTDSTIPNGMNNLVSLRHLVASWAVHSSISNIGKMTSLQELHFCVQSSSCFGVTQLQSMNELVQIGVCQLKMLELEMKLMRQE